jgi:hypothetical protein
MISPMKEARKVKGEWEAYYLAKTSPASFF